MSYGTDIIPWNIPGYGKYPRVFRGILSIPQNIVMDLNNIMIR